MFNKDHGYIVALVALVAVFTWLATDGFRVESTVTIGETVLTFTQPIDIQNGISASDIATVNRFDSFDIPLGIDYSVPLGSNLIILEIDGTADQNSVEIHFGYGDDHVENSVAPPTNFVVLTTLLFVKNLGIHSHPEYLTIPEGKFPAIQVKDSNSSTHFTFAGILKDN